MRHYLLPQEFLLYSNHEALKYLNSQKRLNEIYKWVKFLQDYIFVLGHKTGVENKVTDALSWRVMILVAMSAKVTRLERLREEYESCTDFRKIYATLRDGSVREMGRFLLQDGYLFRFHKLCIPCSSLREFLSWEMHAGGLAGYFCQNKTTEVVEHRFYWLSLKRDVAKIVGQYCMCQLAKQKNRLLDFTLFSLCLVIFGKT